MPDDHPHVPPKQGRALPHHLTHPYCRPPDPVLSPQLPGPPTSTSGTLLPPTTKGRGKGLQQEVWLQAGKGHDRGERTRGRENQTRQPQDAWGRGIGSKPRDSEGVGRHLVTTW